MTKLELSAAEISELKSREITVFLSSSNGLITAAKQVHWILFKKFQSSVVVGAAFLLAVIQSNRCH